MAQAWAHQFCVSCLLALRVALKMMYKAALCAFANVALAQDKYMTEWQQFKHDYGKTYSSPVEEQQRYEIFKVNVDFIHMMNLRQQGYELGVTEFADLAADEFGRTWGPMNIWEKPWLTL